MNPILQVISFLFKKKNIDINIKTCTIKSFFDSGILFLKLNLEKLTVYLNLTLIRDCAFNLCKRIVNIFMI